MACERVVLAALDGDARRREVQRAAAAIAAGKLVVLPTETVYGIAADPGSLASVDAVRALKGRDATRAMTHHLADLAALGTLAAPPLPAAANLARRYWPGPLTLVIAGLATERVGLRIPADDFTRDVIRACGRSLYLTSVNASGEPPATTAEAAIECFGGRLDLVYDRGPSPLGTASTVVAVTGAGIEVLREGILTAAEIVATAAPPILFVCTGNTCRSPMAAALAAMLAAEHLGVEPAALGAHGIAFASAGLAAGDGAPASAGAAAAIAEVGGDLGDHRSRPATRTAIDSAPRVYCMTESHRQRLVETFPDTAAKLELLRPDGGDVADPFGGDTDQYRRTRDEIAAALRARVAAWLEAGP